MIKLDQVIIVEGKYDKIKLASFLDATIITTDGFEIFKDKEKLNLIRNLAEKHGIIILTDSDVAGFKIRNFLVGALGSSKVIQVYIPEIQGKEKRKLKPSKTGILGVEGIDQKIIIDALKLAGVLNNNISKNSGPKITKQDMFFDGFIGQEDSRIKREKLKKFLGLPQHLSTNSLVEVLNKLLTYDEYKNIKI